LRYMPPADSFKFVADTGALAGLYAVAQAVNLVIILTHSTGNVYQVSRIGGALFGLLIGVAISLTLFKSALKKNEVPTDSN